MTPRKAVVETYFEGFRRSDHEQILGCLTDDVVWDLPGFTHLAGKEAFDREIENEDFLTFLGDRICRVESYVVPLK